MSIVVPDQVAASLRLLLESLTSTDNTARSTAEAALNNEWLAQQPEILLLGLTHHACSSESPAVSKKKLLSFIFQ